MAEKNVTEKNVDAIADQEPPQYGALHEKAGEKQHAELIDDTNRRASVAKNIVENPLQVSYQPIYFTLCIHQSENRH